MMEKLRLSKKEKNRFTISVIGLGIIAAIFTWSSLDLKRERQLLNTENIETYATTIKVVNRKRGQQVQYFYQVNGVKYKDWAKVPVINGQRVPVQVPGGRYRLKYYPKKPKINEIELTYLINK